MLQSHSSVRLAYATALTLLAVAATSLPSTTAAAERWVARLANGEIVQAGEIQEWHDADAHPRIAGRGLFDNGNPVDSLIDREGTLDGEVSSYVEFFGGDRMTGEVVGYRATHESAYETAFPHLLVRPQGNFQPPDDPADRPLRVTTQWVRKVAWDAISGARYVPMTAWLRGGGQVAFRSLRWTDSGVTLLTESGLRSFSFIELAEVHLPHTDEWQVYEEQLGVLTPSLSSRIVQIDSADGGRFTTSVERFQARHWGDKKRPESWLQLVQPAWSLDPLWVRFSTVLGWRMFAPTEPPLSMCEPTDVQREAIFGGSWSWQRDRNVQQQRLAVADQLFQRGFGVHGSTRLNFQLPSHAKELRTRCGLDQSAGQGGCVRVSVLAANSKELYASDPFIGSTRVLDTGWLTVPAAQEGQSPQIVLQSDMLQKDTPRGADPFDIRDIVDWGEPIVRLDREQLLSTVVRGARDNLAGLRSWTTEEEDATAIVTRNWFDESDGRKPQFRELWTTTRPYVLMSRSLKVSATDRWLSLVVTRFEKSSKPTMLQIKIDGRSAGEFEVPIRYGPIDPLPISVPLAPGPTRSIDVDVVVYSPGSDCWWDWRGLVASADLPGIYTVYDESSEAILESVVAGLIQNDSAEPFAGKQSLRVDAVRAEAPQVGELSASLVDWPKLGQFRFLTFAWKGAETPGLALWLAHDGRLGPEIASGLGLVLQGRRPQRAGIGRQARLEDRGLKYSFAYDIGQYRHTEGVPLRLDKKMPAEWRFETRDIVNDFGAITLTGFGFESLESGRAWFDAIALARTPEDLEVLKRRYGPAPKPNADATYSQVAHQRHELGPAIADFAPQFATPSAQHGVLQKREHQGQSGGWQTHPDDRNKPFLLRTVYRFPADRPQELDLLVSNQPGSDFRLVVQVNGEVAFEQIINDELTKRQRGWASLQVDLSKYQGQTALLEVLNASNDWSHEHAVWKRVDIRDR